MEASGSKKIGGVVCPIYTENVNGMINYICACSPNVKFGDIRYANMHINNLKIHTVDEVTSFYSKYKPQLREYLGNTHRGPASAIA